MTKRDNLPMRHEYYSRLLLLFIERGELKREEAVDIIAERHCINQLTDRVLEDTHENGTLKVRAEISWAFSYLKLAGFNRKIRSKTYEITAKGVEQLTRFGGLSKEQFEQDTTVVALNEAKMWKDKYNQLLKR